MINPSPTKFNVPEIEYRITEATNITLNQVDSTPVYTIINVDVKVVTCEEPVTLGNKRLKSGWARVQLSTLACWYKDKGIN